MLIALVGRGEKTLDLLATWAALTTAVKGSLDQNVHETLGALRSKAAEAAKRTDERIKDRVHRLNRFFLGPAGFHGNLASYSDPSNSYLDDVVRSRLGIPITLSILFMEFGKAFGLEIEPIAFPGHFLVRERTENILCDPFSGSVDLTETDCLGLAKQAFGREVEWHDDFLSASTKTQMIIRILNNLRNAFVVNHDTRRAESARRLLHTLEQMELSPSGGWLH